MMQKHLIDYMDNSTNPEVRGLRLLVEYFYAHEQFKYSLSASGPKVISVFGSARSKPDSEAYKVAYETGRLLYKNGFAVVTGASAGVMEAANKGVMDAIARSLQKRYQYKSVEAAYQSKRFNAEKKKYSLGLKITLPWEPNPNPYLGIFATFHYFNIRKFYFANISKGFISCDGGWGTMDELYEMLTLVQTGKTPLMPIVVLSNGNRFIKEGIDYMAEKGFISREDLLLIEYAETPKQAVEMISGFYKKVDKIVYPRGGKTVKIHIKEPLSGAAIKELEAMIGAKDSPYEEAHYGEKVIRISGQPHKSFGSLRKVVDIVNNL